jgi:hypothetical protein
MSHYKINIGKWGPAAWDFLHAVSFMIPQNPTPTAQNDYKLFFEKLTDVLPCRLCQVHLSEHIEKDPINVTSARLCSEWLVRLHNAVNIQTGKPSMSYLEVVKQYLPPNMYIVVELTPDETMKVESIQSVCKVVTTLPTRPPKPKSGMQPWLILLIIVIVIAVVTFIFALMLKSSLINLNIVSSVPG